MDHRRIPQQALYWEVPGFKRGPGQPRANWIGTAKKDLQKMTLTWEEAEVAALDRQEWRRSVAQCIHLDVGWIKVKVKTSLCVFDVFSPVCFEFSAVVGTGRIGRAPAEALQRTSANLGVAATPRSPGYVPALWDYLQKLVATRRSARKVVLLRQWVS